MLPRFKFINTATLHFAVFLMDKYLANVYNY